MAVEDLFVFIVFWDCINEPSLPGKEETRQARTSRVSGQPLASTAWFDRSTQKEFSKSLFKTEMYMPTGSTTFLFPPPPPSLLFCGYDYKLVKINCPIAHLDGCWRLRDEMWKLTLGPFFIFWIFKKSVTPSPFLSPTLMFLPYQVYRLFSNIYISISI